jgi:succinate-acetate transporter protein
LLFLGNYMFHSEDLFGFLLFFSFLLFWWFCLLVFMIIASVEIEI